ncbi:DNA ligase IV-like protein [Schizophyllum commune]
MQATPAPTEAPGSPQPSQVTASQQPFPEQPYNTDTLPFHILTAFFEKLQGERKQEKRRKLLNHWFNKWREDNGPDLYPVLRLILPHRDRERNVYGLKEKALAKLYIKVIPLNKNDPDAMRLLYWKKPTEKHAASGDFPTVLYEVVSKRSSVTHSTLTIDDINDMLDELADMSNKSEKQSKIIQRLYNEATPEQQLWFARIILKDMNISVKETTVFAVFHPDAQALYNTCSDLKKVAWQLADPSIRLHEDEKQVKLGQPFMPMLCKRPMKRIEDTAQEMGGAEFIIEEKLDGERMQLHKMGNQFYYSSRKGKDYTYLYGSHVGVGSLTPYIAHRFHKQADSAILDGEMLVWDPVSGRNLPFGTLKTAALDQSKKQAAPRPCLKVFDLLYLNGKSLIDKSTAFRKKNMRLVIEALPGRIEFVDEFKGRTAQDIREKMDEVMGNRGEGLVIKHPKSQYVLNGRNNDWIKVKPEYMDNMGETVDVLVVAGNYGSGRRSGGVSTLICAVLDDRNTGSFNENEPKFSTFVRVGSGLTYADYMWLRAKNWKNWDAKNSPAYLQTAKRSHEDKGDVYLELEDTFVLKVKAAEITPSDQYHVRYTMRFPRALSIREEMAPGDAMTASAVLEQLKTAKKRKMETNKVSSTKKRKVVKKKVEMLPRFDGPDMKDVKEESDLFKGMKFVVISDPKARTGEEDRKKLMTLIRSHGGQCPQFAKDPAAIVVYNGTSTPYDLQLIIRKDTNDVVRPQWVMDCIAKGELVPMEKKYFFFATSARKETAGYGEEGGAESDGSVTQESSDDEAAAEMSQGSKKRKRAGKSAEPQTQDKTANEEKPAAEASKPKVELDPGLAAWLGYDEDDTAGAEDGAGEKDERSGRDDDESDNDSDNQDVKDEEEEDDMAFWFNDDDGDDSATATLPTQKTTQSTADTQKEDDDATTQPEVKMGDDSAMHYDEELIFKHLCFYLDSPSNARASGMSVKSTTHEDEINESFAELRSKIESNGGRVVDLSEPKLTHVVLDKRDLSRRIDLMRRTSKPKRRHLVLTAYIDACLEENTLLDEDGRFASGLGVCGFE